MLFLNLCTRYIVWLWQVTKTQASLSFINRCVFAVLCCLETIYKILFTLHIFVRTWWGAGHVAGAKIISVGNLSLGGTGKSVVVSLVVNILDRQNCAIVLRGYKRNHNHEQLLLVHNGEKILCDVAHAGDEAYMLAQQLNIPVVVCADRLFACRYLTEYFPHISYIILDDSYQNFRIKKDSEILLLDARAPFENGHCLPAGRLREKDYTRADIILLMHTHGLAEKEIDDIKYNLLKNFDRKNILCTHHALTKIFTGDGIIHTVDVLKDKRVLLVAGLGDPSSFIKTIGELGADICDVILFQDHYAYQEQDVEKIVKQALATGCQVIVTTEKDWVKIKPFKDKYYGVWYIPRVSIEFLSQEEYSFFELFLKKN